MGKLTKVQFRYRLPNYQYKQKTMKMEIPTDKLGFILPSILSKNIQELLGTLENTPCVLIWHRIIEN